MLFSQSESAQVCISNALVDFDNFRVLSGQGKPGKSVFFSKSQGKPGKVSENQKNQYKIREKSGNFFSVSFALECFASIYSTRVCIV